MLLAILFGLEAMATESTWERLDAHVRGKVIVQRARALKPSVALVTSIWFLA